MVKQRWCQRWLVDGVDDGTTRGREGDLWYDNNDNHVGEDEDDDDDEEEDE